MLLEEYLKPRGLTQVELAVRMGVPIQRVNTIVNGKRGITAETAILLSEALNTSPEIRMGLQSDHDLWHALRKRARHARSRSGRRVTEDIARREPRCLDSMPTDLRPVPHLCPDPASGAGLGPDEAVSDGTRDGKADGGLKGDNASCPELPTRHHFTSSPSSRSSSLPARQQATGALFFVGRAEPSAARGRRGSIRVRAHEPGSRQPR